MSNQYMGAGYACQYARRSIRAGDAKIEYFIGGKGEPLLYLHGLASWLAWDTDQIGLALTNMVYAPMLPGWKAGQIPRGVASVRDYARLIAAFMDAVAVKRADIVGHSLGGWIALYLAVEHPERVSRLVLVDSMGLSAAESPAADLASMDEDAIFNATFATKGGTLVVAGDFGGQPENVRSGAAFQQELVGQRNLVALNGGKCSDAELTTKIPQIKAPTIVVWGAEDEIVPVAHAERLVELIPQARGFVIEGAGHVPMKEKRQTYLKIVRDFLLGQEGPVEGTRPIVKASALSSHA
jgi:pimeloyl-ACP methyl ester carboxylesterase